MTSLARLKPFYVSMGIRNTGYQDEPSLDYDPVTTPDRFINAIATQTFNAPIVEKASDFLVAVERMELHLNAVPFYDADQLPREFITVRSRLDENLVYETPDIDLSAFSVTHLLDLLGNVEYRVPETNALFRITYSINKDGFIIMTLLDNVDFNMVQIEFPSRLNMILGLSTNQQLYQTDINQDPWVEAESWYPRADIGDDLDHVVLQTNLPTNTDALGNAHIPILTDFSVPTNYSNSLGYGSNGVLVKQGFTSNIRQRMIYVPNERRYLELVGDFPIQDLTISAWYRSVDGSIKKVPLCLGGSFEVKLGFYLKQ